MTERPTRRDGAVLMSAALMLLPSFKQWLSDDEDRGEDADILSDLMEILDNDDLKGPTLARALEDLGWGVDAELNEILNGAASVVHKALDKATAAWIEVNNIKPRLALNDEVLVKTDTQAAKGTVVKISEDGTYCVNLDLIYNWEELEKWNT